MMEKKIPSRIKRKRNIKIKKSTIGIFVAVFAFVFTMFHVFAGEHNTFTVDKLDGNSRGDEVQVNVALDCVDEYNSGMLEIEFDPNVLEIELVETTSYINPTATPIKNRVKINGITMPAEVDDINAEGKFQIGFIPDSTTRAACESMDNFVTMTFYIKDDAQGGKSPITITNAAFAREVDPDPKEDVISETEAGYVEVVIPVDMESVALKRSSYELPVGSNDQEIEIDFSPIDTTDKANTTYVSNNTSVVTVDGNGVMTAIATGETTITVTAFGKEMTANVSVTNHITAVNVTGPNDKHKITMDETLQLTGAVVPQNTDDSKTLTWASTSESVATVDQNGLVTPVGAGTTTISAKSVNDIVGTYEVEVVVPITTFELRAGESSNLSMNKKDSHTVLYDIAPENPSESKEVTWTTTNDSVATVSNGVITAVGGGTAVITGSLGDTLKHFDPITINVTVNVPLDSVSVSPTSVNLFPEQTQEFEATLDPKDATNKTVTWSSSNPDVATVDQNGRVTAVAAGDATITARVEAENKEATASVHVYKRVTGIVMNEPNVTLNKNDTRTLEVLLTPEGADEEVTVSWTSSDSDSVLVDQNGKITARKGTQNPVTITATLSNGAGSATASVTVKVPLTGIALNKSSMTLNKKESETLEVTYTPEDTSDSKEVTWTSGNTKIATVDENGKVTAVGKGVTTITAKVGTFEKVCQVTVNVPVTGIDITDSDFNLPRTETKALTAVVEPDGATYDAIEWASDNISVATVDSNGVVTAKTKGTANITASVGGKSDSVKVTVYVPATSFEAEETSFEILRTATKQIRTTIKPDDADDQKITWTSRNSSVATVDENGLVTGVAEGTTQIIGTLANNLSVTVNVTVSIIPVESVALNKTQVDLLRKKTEKLTLTYSPENATEVEDVVWTSSDETVATVDSTGKVTALKEGTTTITAKMGTLSATATVKVTEVPLAGVSLEDNKTETEVGKDFKLTPKLEPFNATDDVTFTFESSDPEIATVDAEGNVTTKKAGKVKITIKASNGVDEFEDTIEITVNTPSSPKTGVTPVWVYGGIFAILLVIGLVIYKKKELF